VTTLLLLLGYGDTLITASLLEQAGAAASGIRIVGTGLVPRVAEVMRHPIRVDEVIFDEMPAFYTVKKRGIRAALADIQAFRRWSQTGLAAGSTVVFEREPKLRNRALVAGRGCRLVEVAKQDTAYADRARVLSALLGCDIALPPAPLGASPARSLLINPSSRVPAKALSPAVVERLTRQARAAGVDVVLIDVDGEYAGLRSQVSEYQLKPRLADAVATLRRVDRYLGPDSFFLHLAYYYRIPALAFFADDNHYFRPPGLFESGAGMYLRDLDDQALIEQKLVWFLGRQRND